MDASFSTRRKLIHLRQVHFKPIPSREWPNKAGGVRHLREAIDQWMPGIPIDMVTLSVDFSLRYHLRLLVLQVVKADSLVDRTGPPINPSRSSFGENLLVVPEFERGTRHIAHAGTSRETKEKHPVQSATLKTLTEHRKIDSGQFLERDTQVLSKSSAMVKYFVERLSGAAAQHDYQPIFQLVVRMQSNGWWALGIGWEKVDKYFRGDFSGKGKDGVFVHVETCLQVRPLQPDSVGSLLQCQDLSIQVGHAFLNM
ncbi:hypothetical protein C8J57DRAFT_1471050 [Mycena rebaudengoi]|nr:hypothetical protein C8J57DRAFT_1471050 [Mycena rebaudengoi]